MCIMDLSDAYPCMTTGLGLARIVVVCRFRPQDQCYVDLTLPFGLRSSAKLFSEMADALQLCMQYNGATDIRHYLDDYISIGPAHSRACANNLDIMLSTCAYIGFEVNYEKTTLPATVVQYLGFIIDSERMEIRISEDR